jgi:hypothetical protein
MTTTTEGNPMDRTETIARIATMIRTDAEAILAEGWVGVRDMTDALLRAHSDLFGPLVPGDDAILQDEALAGLLAEAGYSRE